MASTYLTRTYQSGGNRKKWTMSMWVKRSKIGDSTNHMLFQSYVSTYTYCPFDTSDRLHFQDGNGGAKTTTMKFRDTNAWYHIVVAIDTDNSTADDRYKIYVNGERITNFDTNSNPSSGYEGEWNKAQLHNIGRHHSGANYYDGLMSHIHFCDGYQYQASDFGETDSVTGEWKIKTSPSVSYGTTGFFILKDGNGVTDQSANSNDWTINGTLTKSEDNPSNVFATMNPLGTYDGTLASGNTQVQTNQTNYRYIASSLGVNKGKWYWEVKLQSLSDYMLCGITDQPSWVTATADSVTMLGNGTYDCAVYTGNLSASGGNGHLYHSSTSNNSSTNTPGAYMAALAAGNILTFALDLDSATKKLYIGVNGQWANGSGATNQTFASASGISIVVPQNTNTGHYFPACGDYSGSNGVWQYNFGNGYFGTTAVSSAGTNTSGIGIFEYDVPAGYTALCTKGLNSF